MNEKEQQKEAIINVFSVEIFLAILRKKKGAMIIGIELYAFAKASWIIVK